MQKFDIDIDICGACTLSCPSCPQGNVKDYRLPQGFMDPDLLRRIVAKAGSECANAHVSLFNWAEPLLHPGLTELVGIVQSTGIPCHLSSNLSILPDADALMAANPASLRISSSGFSQEVYGRTHRGGNIELVKKHMVTLAEARQRHQATTDISLYFHRYRHNLADEQPMREFTTALGFNFHAVWALMLPLEKVLACAGEEGCDFPITEEDQDLITSLALPLPQSLTAAQKYRSRPCTLRENAISLDFLGRATLCCGVYDARKYTLGNYLDMPLEDIQKIRREHPLCGVCMGQGAHVYMTYGIDEMDELALANLAPEDVERLDLRYRIAWEKRQKRLYAFYENYIPKLLSRERLTQIKKHVERVSRLARRNKRSNL